VKLNLSGGICGKCYFIISGAVSDVEEAVKEAEVKAEAGKMLYKTIIPNPAKELLEAIL
jgi:microcompartment protein CcmL/EutN